MLATLTLADGISNRVEDLSTGKVLLSENFNDNDHLGWTIVDEGNVGGPSNWSTATGAFVQRSVMVKELPSKAVLLWDDFSDGKLAGWNIFEEAGAISGLPPGWL
jgi:hypothetical protein